MAKQIIYPKGIVKQGENFTKKINIASEIYKIVKETALKSSQEAFKELGIYPSMNYKGVYGDETVYGKGVENDTYNVIVDSKTRSYLEKNLFYGGNRIDVEIGMEINKSILSLSYQMTEDAFFKDCFISEKMKFIISDLDKFKKQLKKKFDEFAKKEVEYLTSSKLSAQGKILKSTKSMVKENNLSLSKLIKESFKEASEDIDNMFGKNKKKKKGDKDLLLGDKNKDNKKFKTVEERDKELEEITATGGGAGAGAFLAPLSFKKKTPYEEAREPKPVIKKDENGIPYVDVVPLRNGYAPKGMEHNYIAGHHDIEVNSPEELDMASTYRNKFGYITKKNKLDEDYDLDKRKFVSDEENEMSGMNKRYLITRKNDQDTINKRWKRLATMPINETIYDAENVVFSESKKLKNKGTITEISREEAEKENIGMFAQANDSIDNHEIINGREVIEVPKSDDECEFVTYLFYKDDYMNEDKLYLYDHKTNHLVKNPKKQ